MSKKLLYPLLWTIFSFVTTKVVAQETDTDPSNSESNSVSNEAQTNNEPEETAELLNRLNKKITAQQAQIEKLQQDANKQAEQTKQLEEKITFTAEETENLSLSLMETTSPDLEKKLNVYGFMDTSFTAAFPQKKHGEPNWNSPIFIETKRRSTFYQTGVNLYFKSEMTSTLEALVETRFTYQPNGDITSYPKVYHVAGLQSSPEGVYTQTNTSVRQHYSGDIRLGGVLIERAQLDWKPRDWLHFRVGRFLSPFGIWHENHGSTVRLTASEPFIISHNYLPNAQTGIMVGGKVFPTDNLDIEYAVTLSNGRGPFDEFADLDRNKALGLRAKINLTVSDFFASAGAYGYMGQYTNSTNALHVYINDTGTGFDETEDQPVQWVETVTEKYDEMILATELQFQWKGVQLFGEYVRGYTEYVVPTKINDVTPLFVGSATDVDAIEANHISQAWYVVAAYELPLQRLIKHTKITPFIGFDHLEPSDIYNYETVSLIQGGFNIKPSPYVVLKTNVYCIIPDDKTLLGGNTWFWTNQVAVSF